MSTVTNFQFAYGNGVQTAFTLMDPSGDVAGAPTVTALYQKNWQGTQLLYTTSRTNLCPRSSDFSNAAWGPVSMSITPSVLGPDGTLSAFTLTATAPAAYIAQYLNSSYPLNHVTSFWIRRRTGSGNITIFNPNNVGQTTIPVTGAWTQFSVTSNVTAFPVTCGVVIATNGDAIDIAFGQAELGTTPTSYIPTVAAAASNTDYSMAGAVATVAPAPPVGATLLWTGTDSNGPFIPGHSGVGASSSFGNMGAR